jgi:Family of unknown function (DUF6152)
VRRTLFGLLVFGLMAGVTSHAHHSFARDYFEDRSISIEGEVQQFELRNPHAVLYVRAADDTGQLRMYAAEWGAPSRLARSGVDINTLSPAIASWSRAAPGAIRPSSACT